VAPAHPRRGFWLALTGALAALGTALYAVALDAPFYLDDHANIVENPWIRWDGLRLDLLPRTLFQSPTLRPVANLSFALSYLLHGLDPRGFRLENLAILVACGVLVARLAAALLARLQPAPPEPALRGMALLAGLLYVAHPLEIQSTTYLVQRMTALSVLFYLAALLCWLRARERGPAAGRWLAAAALCGLLALGSKEIAVTLPAAIWLIEWCFYRDLDARFLRRTLVLVLPPLALGALAFALLADRLGLGYAGRAFTPVERLLTQLRVVAFYSSLVAWPLPSRLNLLHEFPLSRGWLAPPSTLFSALWLATLAFAGVALARRARPVFFGLAWCALQLLLESVVLPVAPAFEHRLALPMVGLCLAAAWGCFALFGQRTRPALALGLSAAAALGVATYARNALWRDEPGFWSDVAAKSPGLAAPHTNLGMALLGAGRLDEAEASFHRALAIAPRDAEVWNDLGNLELRRGRRAEAIANFRAALEAEPSHYRALYSLGMTLAQDGDLARALPLVQSALRVAPNEAAIWDGLGSILRAQGREAEAEQAYRRSLALDPTYPFAQGHLAELLAARAAAAGAAPTPK